MLKKDVVKNYIESSPQNYRNYTGTLSIKVIDDVTTYEDFFTHILLPNIPCILSANFTDHWKSRSDWVSGDGSWNASFLERNFGEAVAPVADCSIKHYNAQLKEEMLVKDYLSYWQKLSDETCTDLPCLYLKDWHFTKDFPNYQAYETPMYFRSDWLNEFWKQRDDIKDDYCFVYMGPKGTWTPFHADVFSSYSWSANVCGKKRWILFPPGTEVSLQDQSGHLIYDVSLANDNDSHFLNTASFDEALSKGIEVIQEAGEVIFVPSGWHHQVWNIEDTISINHNWLNGCNVDIIWKSLQSALKDVEKEIYDCKSMDDWNTVCQAVLKANHGMDYTEFFKLLECVANRALQDTSSSIEIENKSNPKDLWHSIFDIYQVKDTLDCMKPECEQILPQLNEKISVLLARISDVLNCYVNFQK